MFGAGVKRNVVMSEPIKKPVFISASRLDTFIDCSQKYAAKYVLKFPDPGNEGSSRGSTVHDVLELLLKPKHEKLYSKILHHGTCEEVPAVWRLLKAHARKNKVADDKNMKMIDGFMMVALKNEFKGPKNTVKTHGEKEFQIEVDKGGKRYFVRGFIDQTFELADEKGCVVELDCRDFKSSKVKFTDDKIDNNLQASIYQLALRHLYPEVKKRRFRFLFLKFPKIPWVELPALTDAHLDGFEWFLTEMQGQLEAFTWENRKDNLAAFNPEKQWLCGREGIKKDGNPNFICPQRKPVDYWVSLDKDGEIVGSGFTEEELKALEGGKIEKRRYTGCSAYFSDTERPRSFS